MHTIVTWWYDKKSDKEIMTFSKWMRIVLPVGGLFSYCFYFNSNLMIIWWEDRKPLGNLHSILIMIVVAMCTYRDYTILDCFSISNNHTDGLSDELLWHGRSKNPYRTRCNRVSCATRVSLQCQSHNICTTYTPLCVFLRIYKYVLAVGNVSIKMFAK